MHRFRQTTNERRTARPLAHPRLDGIHAPAFPGPAAGVEPRSGGSENEGPWRVHTQERDQAIGGDPQAGIRCHPAGSDAARLPPGPYPGRGHKHWFRARFFQQYRLFFRFHAPSKIIVFAWVNDEDTKRAYEGSDDAYRVFRKMLANGHPPGDWDSLLAQAKSPPPDSQPHA